MRSHFTNAAVFFGTVGVFVLMVGGFVGWPPPANALARSLGELKTASVTCLTTPTEIVAADPMKNSMTLKNATATAVFVGGSDVDGATAGTTGISVCSSGCDFTNVLAIDARRAWCMSVGGTDKLEVVYAR